MDPNQQPQQPQNVREETLQPQPAQVFQPSEPAPEPQPESPTAPSAEPAPVFQPEQPAAVPFNEAVVAAPAPSEPAGDITPPVVTPETPAAVAENPEKSYLVTLLLSYFLGGLGVDRYYLGKVGTGVLKMVTFGGFGIWHVVDLLLIAFGKLHAKGDDRPLEGFAKNRGWIKLVTIILVIFNLVVLIGVVVVLIIIAATGAHQGALNSQF